MTTNFKIGDTVKLITTKWGDTPDNPVWDKNFGRIFGVVINVTYLSCCVVTVRWDNGWENTYYSNELKIAVKNELPDDLFII